MLKLRRLHYHLPHYFAKHLSLGLEELFLMVGLNDLAQSAIMVFEPVYLLSAGLSLASIAFFYFLVYLGYVLMVPLGGMIAARIGYPRTILLSSVFLISYYAALFAIPLQPIFFWIAPLAYAIQKTLYWPAFESDFVRYAHRQQEGEELSGILSLSTIVTVVGPFMGGLLIKFYGFPALFGLVIGLILFSNIPLFFSKNPASHEPVQYGEAWRTMLGKKQRRAFWAYLGFSEELIVLVFWPIAIFLIVKNFAGVGALVAAATLVTALVTLYIGKLTDQHKQPRLIRFGSTATSLTWLSRVLAFNPVSVFVVDIFSRLFKSILYVPLLEMTFERAAKNGPLRTTVFFEQSLAVGKMLTALLLFVAFQFTSSLWVAFGLAAATAWLYQLIIR